MIIYSNSLKSNLNKDNINFFLKYYKTNPEPINDSKK